jgi:hypothetical protein
LPEGIYQPVPIMGEGEFDPIEFNENGGLFHLVEGTQILPYSTIILQLQKISP